MMKSTSHRVKRFVATSITGAFFLCPIPSSWGAPSSSKMRALTDHSVNLVIIEHPRLYLDKPGSQSLGGIVKLGDSLVLNGPLFDTAGIPVGGYITQVATGTHAPGINAPIAIKPMTKISVSSREGNFAWRNEIFGERTNGSFFMMPYERNLKMTDVVQMQNAIFAIQNGPALIINGQNIHDQESRSKVSRIGIGFTDHNELVVADSQKPVTMYELAAVLLRHGVKQAIYLDGFKNGLVRNMRETGSLPRNAFVLHIR